MKLPDVRFIRKEMEEYQRLLALICDEKDWKTAAWEKKLQRHAAILADTLWEVTKLIAAIPDSELRLLFELRYFRGYTWQEVANAMPTRLSAGAARMKHDRHLASIKGYSSNKEVGSQG